MLVSSAAPMLVSVAALTATLFPSRETRISFIDFPVAALIFAFWASVN
jgi:hypothetical protein